MTYCAQNRFEKTMIRKTACSCIPQRMSGSGEFCLTGTGIFEGKFFRGVRQNQNNQPETVSTSDPKNRVCRAAGFLRFAILRRNIRRFSRNRLQLCRIRFQMPSLTLNSQKKTRRIASSFSGQSILNSFNCSFHSTGRNPRRAFRFMDSGAVFSRIA